LTAGIQFQENNFMAEVKVLIAGVHRMTTEETVEVWCTTTLIKSDINIIVDPGSFVNRDKLIDALEAEGLKTTDIQAVILTHTHIDHTANMSLFGHAKIYSRLIGGTSYKGQYQLIDQGLVHRFDILNQSLAQDVKIIDTLGHTIDSITALIETKDGMVAICGDAMANESFANLEKKPDINLVYSMEKYEESRKKILSLADWIVPGHGGIFKVNR
jgi:glyoxylase-like metal-dependent hydrolase (beta-lactamase superfamily II)